MQLWDRCWMLRIAMWHCSISLSVRLKRPCYAIGQTMTKCRLESQPFHALGPTLFKAYRPESLSSPAPYLSIVFFSTSEEEAKSKGNKRPCFPPLGLGECREADTLSSSESENDQKQSESCGRRGNKLLWESEGKNGKGGERREGGMEEKRRRAGGEATLGGEDSVCSSLG